ncbi:uncharacterized protein LOC130818434 [Amaranthus tricolor]|uniref:uncharacterized protein LOC130818434 n=1 Tax=Amaranthus tricolor TaxID=29722 RepID=UPI00259128DC|nr:uncharacterized protein LOC130818434 [Amaranthus tricolor]
MGRTKVVGPDNISIEVWKGLGEEGIRWLTNLFNIILRTHKMPKEWRICTVIPLFKSKSDAHVCGNYRGELEVSIDEDVVKLTSKYKKFPRKFKRKFYRVAIRPTLLYGSECWSVKKIFEHKMKVTEMDGLSTYNSCTSCIFCSYLMAFLCEYHINQVIKFKAFLTFSH